MKITAIETVPVSAGWKNWLLLRIHTDTGLHGIGEGTLNGFIRTTEAAVQELEHLALGQDPRQVNRLSRRLMDSVSLDGGHIHRTAVAAIEVACWDILGKSLGVPIHQLLGGRMRDSVAAYANGWYRTERTPEAFVQAAEGVVAMGFQALKLDPSNQDARINLQQALRELKKQQEQQQQQQKQQGTQEETVVKEVISCIAGEIHWPIRQAVPKFSQLFMMPIGYRKDIPMQEEW